MSGQQETNRDRSAWPSVSVVMPVRNEATHLERAVASILAQEYPIPFDVCLAVGPSGDDTHEVAARIARREPRVSVVDNPAGVTPAGLNAAIQATAGSIIVRVDGHAELSSGYIQRAVETMQRTEAVNVGGIQDARGETRFERSVASAMTSWLGTGGSKFHVGGAGGPVDTVYLGVFDRTAGDRVGWFDETLIRNQDYELNTRLRRAGGTVWFDPALSVTYRPRSSLRALARQYFDYGYWKAHVLRRDPRSIRVRQVLPLLLPGAIVGSVVGARRWPSLLAVPLGYLAASGLSSGSLQPVIPTMHFSWAAGFIRRLISGRSAPVR